MKNILKEKKRIVLIASFALVAIIASVFIMMSFTRSNPSSGIIALEEEVTVDGLKFKDIDVKFENGLTTYTATVENTGEAYTLKYVQIEIYKDEDVIGTLIGYVGEEIGTNKTKKITSSIDKNIEDATDIKYTIIKE